MIPFAGFIPDADWTVPGAIADCVNLIPTEKGMAGGPTPIVAVPGLAALPGVCRGAAVLVNTLGSRRNFAGTQTALYELTGATWTNVSRVVPYTGSPEARWSFTQFGNAALAANDADVIQASTSGAFADIAGAPAAKILVSAKDFVIAFATNEGTFGDQPDRWWCSAFQNHTSWAPSLATQATSGRLVGVPGGITAAAMLGGYAVAYKERGMYLGQYVGSPIVWQFDQIPGEVGCVGQEAVVDIGGAHFFVGPDNIWLFDGTRPLPIATDRVRQFFFDDCSATYRYRTIVTYDRQNSRVWIFYPGSSSSDGTPDRTLVYHLVSKRWGRANRSIQAAFQFVTPGLTWDTFNSVAASWDALPNIPWNSQSWQAAGRSLAVFDGTNNLVQLTGNSDASSLTTGDVGDDWSASFLDRVAPRFLKTPTTSAIQGFSRDVQGGTLTTRGSGVFADHKYDITQDARWHRFSMSFTGDVEIVGADYRMRRSGQR